MNLIDNVRVRKSRDGWKAKAITRGLELKKLSKREAYYRLKVDNLKNQIKNVSEELKAIRRAETCLKPECFQASLSFPKVYAILLVFIAVVSFRSVPKILHQTQQSFALPFKVPHFTTVINWCLRVGLAAKQSLSPLKEPWIALIDLSIDVGLQKMLVVLRVPLTALQKRGSALSLEDCECCACLLRESWKGEDVADALETTFAQSGVPVAVLKDQGSELAKGFKIAKKAIKKWTDKGKNSGGDMVSIVDVGHFAACALKAWSRLQEHYESFVRQVSKSRKIMSLNHFAFLKPPALRPKGRFMSITALAKWAIKIIPYISETPLPTVDEKFKRIRRHLLKFKENHSFLLDFCHICTVVNKFLKHLKNYGINQKNAKEARAILSELPEKNIVRQKLEAWVHKTLNIHCRMGIGQTPLPVSTDILESLFGKFKFILQRSTGKTDFNRTILLIHALCGPMNENRVSKALDQVSQKQLEIWEKENIFHTQEKKKRDFFSSISNPKIGEKVV